MFTATSHTIPTLPAELRFWTWAEAIEVASRSKADGYVRVRRECGMWVVRFHYRPMLINRGA